MIRMLFSVLLLTLTLTPVAAGSNGVRCALDVSQFDAAQGKDVKLFADTVDFVKGMTSSGFIVAFSTDIEFTEIDTASARFTVHTVTLNSQAKNYSKAFTVQYGLPARLGPIEGKNGAAYSLVITPIAPIDIDTSSCSINHRTAGAFTFSPSANLDIYYTPGSLGEVYFNVAKWLLEDTYRRMVELYQFNLPGKYNIYLAPCPLYTVNWDQRFGTSADPTRSTSYCLLSKRLNTLDPFVIAHPAILRNFGYAPIFVTEGLANFLSFSAFDMKKIVAAGKTVPIRQLLNTYYYYNADAHTADRSSASFVRYLVRQYNFDKLKTVYDRADDLNLGGTIEEVYAKSIEELESEWLHYVDTIRLDRSKITKHMDISEALFNYSRMLEYARALLEESVTIGDSLDAHSALATAHFLNGDYFNAIEAQKKLVTMSGEPKDWMSKAVYEMMNGFYDEARADILTARSLDSNDVLIRFNLALSYLIAGENDQAANIFRRIIAGDDVAAGAQGESRVILAEILKKSDNEDDRQQAETYFTAAKDHFQRSVQQQPTAALFQIWLGQAYLGLDDAANAYNHLQVALFLETRPFYQGLTTLLLGKTADVMGERELAREYYGQVLALPAAAYHQAEAQKYLDEPYSQ
jgi:tetratricopeptide (TPR) repeat protein